MIKTIAVTFFSFLFIIMCHKTYAQSKSYQWPQDKKTAQGYHALYTDALLEKDYAKAREPLEWLLDSIPMLHKSLYQHGEILYTKLADQETDSLQRTKYQSRAIEILDLRAKYYQEEALVINKKARLSYKFYRTDVQKYKELIDLLVRAIAFNREKVYDINLIAVMDILYKYKKNGGTLSDAEVIQIYEDVGNIMEIKLEKAQNDSVRTKKLEGLAEKSDLLLSRTIKMSCEFIFDNFGSRIEVIKSALSEAEQKKSILTNNDIRSVKITLKFMKIFECENERLFEDGLKIIYIWSPTTQLAIRLARTHLKKNLYEQALNYYEDALTLTTSSQEKANLYLEMARVYAKMSQKSTSRNFALQALAADPKKREAYSFIGSLYFSSYETCSEKKSRVADKAVFIAAYNMFQKAGDTKMMQQAKKQFPTAEEIFELGLEEGMTIKINCWIQKEVTLIKATN